jgi:hypothetical protein
VHFDRLYASLRCRLWASTVLAVLSTLVVVALVVARHEEEQR